MQVKKLWNVLIDTYTGV